MAIWQFQFALIPKAGLFRAHPNGVLSLPQYKTLIDGTKSHFSENDEYLNYWEGFTSWDELLRDIKAMLPLATSWSDDAKFFGESEGNRIELWRDDVLCFVDARNFSLVFLGAILSMAQSYQCLIVLHETGELIEPTQSVVIEKMKSSRAVLFCKSPENFLRDSKQVQTKIAGKI
jgi:hypothetical protein